MRLGILAVGCLPLLSGCMTAEQQRAADEAQCRSYGFTKRNDAFAACLQRIDLARQAELQANSGFYGWNRPVVFYAVPPRKIHRGAIP
ncbi:MAG: hypothetical protein ABWY13_03500 [Mesorhizobium sp.]|uniref:hypothetical protein n=1 Tax=Devosia sp. TaxID=1871048 RepID=UPI003395A635